MAKKKTAIEQNVERMSDEEMRAMLKAIASQLDKQGKKETPVPKDWLQQTREICKDLVSEWKLEKEVTIPTKLIVDINLYGSAFTASSDFDDSVYDAFPDKEVVKIPEVAAELERRKTAKANLKKSVSAMAKQLGMDVDDLWTVIDTKNNSYYHLWH